MKQLEVLKKPQEIRFFVFLFHVLLFHWLNQIIHPNRFMILIISFTPSFPIHQLNHFCVLTSTFAFFFLSNLFIAFEVKLLTNPSKLSLDKGIAIFVYAFFPKLPNQELKDPSDWIILDIWLSLSFIFVDIFLPKVFLVWVVCLVVRNNSCGNSSCSKFFVFNIYYVLVLFFAADFNLFNCVFVRLTCHLWLYCYTLVVYNWGLLAHFASWRNFWNECISTYFTLE